VGRSAFGSGDPRSKGPWRIVADVLRMAAFELGDPVQVFILLKADDFSWGTLRMRGLVHGLLILGRERDGGNKANDLCGL
jgi:hypothetical protein